MDQFTNVYSPESMISAINDSADSFLSRAGGPRDRSPLGGLGGERPKVAGEQEGHPGAIWGCRRQSTRSFLAK